MTERRISSEYFDALARLNLIEDIIRSKYTSERPEDQAKVDALKYAQFSLGYAKLAKGTFLNDSFSEIETSRWTTAILSIKENDWTNLKQEILVDSQQLEDDDVELPEASQAFRNLANSLP